MVFELVSPDALARFPVAVLPQRCLWPGTSELLTPALVDALLSELARYATTLRSRESQPLRLPLLEGTPDLSEELAGLCALQQLVVRQSGPASLFRALQLVLAVTDSAAGSVLSPTSDASSVSSDPGRTMESPMLACLAVCLLYGLGLETNCVALQDIARTVRAGSSLLRVWGSLITARDCPAGIPSERSCGSVRLAAAPKRSCRGGITRSQPT